MKLWSCLNRFSTHGTVAGGATNCGRPSWRDARSPGSRGTGSSRAGPCVIEGLGHSRAGLVGPDPRPRSPALMQGPHRRSAPASGPGGLVIAGSDRPQGHRLQRRAGWRESPAEAAARSGSRAACCRACPDNRIAGRLLRLRACGPHLTFRPRTTCPTEGTIEPGLLFDGVDQDAGRCSARPAPGPAAPLATRSRSHGDRPWGARRASGRRRFGRTFRPEMRFDLTRPRSRAFV